MRKPFLNTRTLYHMMTTPGKNRIIRKYIESLEAENKRLETNIEMLKSAYIDIRYYLQTRPLGSVGAWSESTVWFRDFETAKDIATRRDNNYEQRVVRRSSNAVIVSNEVEES